MYRILLGCLMLASAILSPQPSLAKSTGWIDLTSSKEVKKLNDLFDRGQGQGIVPKKIACKIENSRLYAKIEYGNTGTQSIYYTKIDFWKNIEPEFKKYKRRGAIIVSRSDIDTNKGMFTCIIWRKWY